MMRATLGVLVMCGVIALFRWGNAPGCIGLACCVASWFDGYQESTKDQKRRVS